jgi:Peroxiredoxin
MKKWIRSTSIILFALACVFTATAQNITITGRVNKHNALIRLFVYEDLLNWEGKQIAEVRSDDKGNFILEGSVNQILPAKIFVGLENVDFYLTPNATYNMEIIIPIEEENVSYFDKPTPTLRVKKATDKGIYRQMIISEEIINTYLLNYFNQIYRQRKYQYLDSIWSTINETLPDIESDYVKNFINYKIASIHMAINADDGKKVIREYFDGKPILYTQPSYIELFKDLFSNKFLKSPYTITQMKNAVWTSPEALRDYLKTDPLMAKNPQLAEFITIYNLQKIYYEDNDSRKLAVDHLEAIKESSKYPEHKTIISDIFNKFYRFAEGAKASDFELKDSAGKTVKLSDYKKKMVLLQFVEGFSAVTNQQFTRLKELHEQWQDSVQIITIATKDRVTFYEDLFKKQNLDWQLLDLNNDILLLEKYNVRTFPEYVIIKPDTKIGIAPAPAPDQFLEYHIRRLYRNTKKH